MNTIKTLKSYVFYTLLALCGFAIWYLGTAFVLMELNPVNWEESTRFIILWMSVITSAGITGGVAIMRGAAKQNY